ncbi:MAG: hypothetical protein L6R42_000011 [Xanthoria sp. 1 TBL-2021]|nr:MAG: hypothetical protein L6R42_000011 [Xanthoria sp. 1 TBL-2021]
MWLLNTSSFKLEEFYSDVPSYAILSHRWKKDEELSFGGLEEPHPQSNRTGYKKVKTFCVEARKRRLAYVWADTCCIDKKSSAELSEAINSMYAFYNRAAICYVYLYDVISLKDFEQSSWFTRGWTLQELLAPSKAHFFNREWKPIGSRRRLAPKIERTTGIPRRALRSFSLDEYCVAEKLSWSAKRITTREEDCAYCLLGLFQINMPLLYGEGTRAFRRLQEEIMKTSTDMSIFLWQGPAVDTFGMLASNPSCFSDIPDSVRSMTRNRTNLFSMSEGWSLNNAGISIEASIYPYLLTDEFECIFALYLHEPHASYSLPGLAIFVKKHDTRQGIRTFARVTIDGIAWTSSTAEPNMDLRLNYKVVKLRLLRQPLEDVHTPTRSCGFTVSFTSDALDPCAAYQRPSGNFEAKFRSWQEIRKTCNGSLKCSFSANPTNATGVHGYLLFTLMDDIQILICLGLSDNFQPLCIMLPFCKQMLDKGLGCVKILREYNSISRYQSDFFEIFDTEIQMICLRGEDQTLESFTDIGLSLEISDRSSHTGKLEAEIKFDVEKFVQYYIPTADLLCYGSINCIPREIFEQLLDVELKIGPMRRNRYFF